MISLQPTLTLDQAATESWDVLVVGAGPGGAVAAITAAHRGLRVLLVDKMRFARSKVCGCCLNHAAVSVLQRIGADDLLTAGGAVDLDQMILAADGCCAHFALPRGVAISRAALDSLLIDRAVESGVHFLDQAAVRIHNGAAHVQQHEFTTRVILVCDGLKGTALDARNAPIVRPGARLGIATVLDTRPDIYPPGVIHMACGVAGYVGMVRVEDGRLHLAAAVDPQAITRYGRISCVLQHLIARAGLEPPTLPDANSAYRGVGALTRRRSQWWQPRVLIMGDAASYIEPFTGEGMGWAMAGGVHIAPFLQTIVRDGWHDAIGRQWQRHWQRRLARRQRLCRIIAWTLRHTTMTRMATRILRRWPGAAGLVTRRLNRPWQLEEAIP